MSLVGGPTDLQSSSTFYSIAYDPPTKSLWLSVGDRVYLYDLSNPTSPVFIQSLAIPQGFSPFEGGVVFDVAGRRGYYVLTGQSVSGQLGMKGLAAILAMHKFGSQSLSVRLKPFSWSRSTCYRASSEAVMRFLLPPCSVNEGTRF
jgi:hypothetical protein